MLRETGTCPVLHYNVASEEKGLKSGAPQPLGIHSKALALGWVSVPPPPQYYTEYSKKKINAYICFFNIFNIEHQKNRTDKEYLSHRTIVGRKIF